MIKFALQIVTTSNRKYYMGFAHNSSWCFKPLNNAFLWDYPTYANQAKTNILLNGHIHNIEKIAVVEIEIDEKGNRNFKQVYTLPDGYNSSFGYAQDINKNM
jgi:hypothetical protein